MKNKFVSITVTSAYPPERGFDINNLPVGCEKVCPPIGPCYVKCLKGRR